MVLHFYAAYMTAITSSLWISFLGQRSLTKHGSYAAPGSLHITKNCFASFYLAGIVSFLLTSPKTAVASLYALHVLRRLAESLCLRYTRGSRMHVLHLLLGLSYYPMQMLRYSGYAVHSTLHCNVYLFALLNVAQSALHYTLFTHRVSIFYLHYLTEILIYLSIDRYNYLNLAWLLSFVFISICNRRDGEKRREEKEVG